MRSLTITETEAVSGGLLDVCIGDVTALNKIAVGNENAVLSGNKVKVSDNLSHNSVDVGAKVAAMLSDL